MAEQQVCKVCLGEGGRTMQSDNMDFDPCVVCGGSGHVPADPPEVPPEVLEPQVCKCGHHHVGNAIRKEAEEAMTDDSKPLQPSPAMCAEGSVKPNPAHTQPSPAAMEKALHFVCDWTDPGATEKYHVVRALARMLDEFAAESAEVKAIDAAVDGCEYRAKWAERKLGAWERWLVAIKSAANDSDAKHRVPVVNYMLESGPDSGEEGK